MMNFQPSVSQLQRQVISTFELGQMPVVLIDGRAASGKSTFAKLLQESLFKSLEQLPRLIQMDDLYPGWEGLTTGASYLSQQILRPIRTGKTAQWQVWDWQKGERGKADEPGNGWREFSGGTPLIVEGCGSLSRVSSELADYRIWIEAPQDVRHARWLERDGEKFNVFWHIWAAQEDEFYQQEKSKSLADLVIEN